MSNQSTEHISTQSTEDFLAQVNGTIEALVLGFGILAATHPEKEKVTALIKTMIDQYAPESDADTPNVKALKAGMKKAAETLLGSIAVANLALQAKNNQKH
jgi:hypothetical protein